MSAPPQQLPALPMAAVADRPAMPAARDAEWLRAARYARWLA
jgi:hypothetical protein